jgi:hypothetical protein
MAAQTVIYRLDAAHEPTWQFHSMPESVVGGGNTLDEARERYREALRFSLDTDRLPEVREFIEREAHLGIWVRTLLGSPIADNAFNVIAKQLSQYSGESRDWFFRRPSAGGDPVAVECGPDDTLGGIFDQMTQFDSLIAVMAHGEGNWVTSVVWVGVQGVQAAPTLDDDPPVRLDQLGLTRDSRMAEVFLSMIEHFGTKPTALLAPA